VITGLDHVVLVTLDLASTVAEWRQRGFSVHMGGAHAGGLSENALVGFADGSYIELFAFVDLARARGVHQWASVAERGGGWADFALASNDLVHDTAALGDLVTGPIGDGGRTRPDGLRIAWRSARLAAPLPFLIQDVTARELRVPSGEAARHANGTTGIATVVVGGRDPVVLTRRYAMLRELGAPPIEIVTATRESIREVTFH
jgi:hypothetical protein